MDMILSLCVSLILTLLLEFGAAILWRVKRQDWSLIILVNLLTNPVVVLCYHIVAAICPKVLLIAVFALELGAIVTEGYLYQTRSEIRLPWIFALCGNLFSYTVGLLC